MPKATVAGPGFVKIGDHTQALEALRMAVNAHGRPCEVVVICVDPGHGMDAREKVTDALGIIGGPIFQPRP